MNIVGIGTDIIQISRMTKLRERFGEKFVGRILSPEEIKVYSEIQNKDPYLAKRFAAKEAIAKALGVGIGPFFGFTEISVTNLVNGQPIVNFSGKACDFVASLNIKGVMVSLSDEKEYAIAFVIVT